MTLFEKSYLAVTIIGIVVGVGVLIVYSKQLNQMKTSTKAAQDSALAASNAVAQAQTAMNASIAASRLDHRAWIAIKEITFRNHRQAGQIPGAEIVIVNTGRTPALDVSVIKSVRIDTSLPEGGMPHAVLTHPSVGVLGPGIEFVGTSFLTRPRTELEVTTLQQGVTHLYAYGVITYKDIFDTPHFTEYCVESIPSSPAGEGAICSKWNRTD